MGSKPTIRDVAREAGVSIATVSYVLNGNVNEDISAPVRERVREAVRKLDYHRAASAVSLATRRSRNVGIIVCPVHSDVTNPFYSFVIDGVIREVTDRRYNLLFAYIDSSEDGPAEVPQMIRESNVAGVLFVGRVDRAMVLQSARLGMRVVTIDPGVAIEGVPSVRIADCSGGRIAARHLLELGHRQMAFVGLVPSVLSIADRHKGFRAALAEAGPAVQLEAVRCPLTYEESYAHVCRLLDTSRPITAIFGANDEVAAGAIRAARERGRAVPADLSVVGFDDIIMARYTDPPLTTVAVPKESLGRRAAAMLVNAIDGECTGQLDEVVPVALITRESTATPRSPDAPARGRRSRRDPPAR
jgi:LacI family transcriptional regulator